MFGSILGIERLAHGWQVLASLLLSAAVTVLCYALSQAGLSELAGTAMSFYAVFVGTRLLAIASAGRSTGHFAGSREMLRQVQADLRSWMLDRTVLSIFLLGVPAAVAYVALRSACIAALGVFANIWFALAFGLAFGALVASPILFRDLGRLVARDAHGPEVVSSGDSQDSQACSEAPEAPESQVASVPSEASGAPGAVRGGTGGESARRL